MQILNLINYLNLTVTNEKNIAVEYKYNLEYVNLT